MEPIDFKKATYEDLEGRIRGQRERALLAWRMHGPGTTARVARRAGMSILSFRPRTTELYQLGYLRLADEQPRRGEGVYQARTPGEHQAWYAQRRTAATQARQLQMQF